MSISQIARVQFPADQAQMGETLSGLRKYIAEVGKKVGLEPQAVHRLQLAADEITTNIILYGYRDVSDGVIVVSAIADGETLRLVVEDTGTPFDPLAHPEPQDLDAPLDERDIGGLGVFLAIRSVDDLQYERDGVHNRTTFVMKCPSGAS